MMLALASSTIARRTLLAALLAAAGAASAQAPGWPARPVKFINSFPPGGPSDLVARSIADVLQNQLKQPFIVENKAGASGNIGSDTVAKSPADGHTILFGIDTTTTINPHIYKGMPFKPADLRPVMVMASSGLLVGDTSFDRLQDAGRPGGGRQEQGRVLQFGRQRQPGPPGRRVVQPRHRHEDHARALQGQHAGGHRGAFRRGERRSAGHARHAAAREGRQDQRAGGHQPQALRAGTGGAHGRRGRPAAAGTGGAVRGDGPSGNAGAGGAGDPEGDRRRAGPRRLRARLDGLDLHYEGVTGAAAATRLQELSERYGKVIRSTGMKVE